MKVTSGKLRCVVWYKFRRWLSCRISYDRPDDGGIKYLLYVGKHLPHCTAQNPKDSHFRKLIWLHGIRNRENRTCVTLSPISNDVNDPR
jgi:hypothetical protein